MTPPIRDPTVATRGQGSKVQGLGLKEEGIRCLLPVGYTSTKCPPGTLCLPFSMLGLKLCPVKPVIPRRESHLNTNQVVWYGGHCQLHITHQDCLHTSIVVTGNSVEHEGGVAQNKNKTATTKEMKFWKLNLMWDELLNHFFDNPHWSFLYF